MTLLYIVERYLNHTGTSATRFGREAVNDPRFVIDLRNGREPRASVHARVAAYVATHGPRRYS